MTEPYRPRLLIIADSPEALTDLCGISLLERMRRIALNLGFREAMILSNSVKAVAAHLANESWRRADVSLTFRERTGVTITVGDILDCLAALKVAAGGRILIVFGGFYCDERLLASLADAQTSSVIIDSDPPSIIAPILEDSGTHSSGRLWCAALLSTEWLSQKNRDGTLVEEITSDMMAGRIARVDAARQQAYVGSMRRSVRPIFFPAPSLERRPLAERLLRDATQKGVLDFPAVVHAPIEKWLVAHLCRTSITPNQITLGTGVLGLGVTLLYASGYLWAGVLLALVIGVLDGIDGKLARLKAQTTKLGKKEHDLDYFVETSWWAALAYHFHATSQIRYAYVIFIAFFAFDRLERVAKQAVQRRIGRNLDDFAPFDRFVRIVAGRRNIYTWLFAFFLVIGAPATGFMWLCFWGVASAVIHILRAVQIGFAGQDRVASTSTPS
ncbi:MAG TPA: CDP-alcohol phosphatidyltransferase family protein [Candidatus Udaeobacter sp.]|jgi:phosphatidylglycerophosphate synthase|nr:CDP-alcohol phosphatidyltransferase family protein [Candidatus Udaeobacter sp.]